MAKTLAGVVAVSMAALLFAGCGESQRSVSTTTSTAVYKVEGKGGDVYDDSKSTRVYVFPPSTTVESPPTTVQSPSTAVPATASGKLSNQCSQGVDGFIAAMNSLYQNMEQVYPKSFDMKAANDILVESFGGVSSRCGDNEKSTYMSEIITRLSVGRQTQGPVARAAATKTISAMCEVADGLVTLNPQAAAACI